MRWTSSCPILVLCLLQKDAELIIERESNHHSRKGGKTIIGPAQREIKQNTNKTKLIQRPKPNMA